MSDIIKSPEQLVVDDVIPNWGDDLVVEHVVPMTAPDSFASDETELVPCGYRVRFTDGSFAVYPVGVAIRVITPE